MARKPCKTGKQRFPDRVAALVSMADIRQRSHRDVVPTRAYRCPFCKGWHLTSRPARPRA
jgi:hypothetical protein